MKQYKVIALSVGADSNRIFNAGEIVNEDAWTTPGRAEELKEQGFLVDYSEEEQQPEGTPYVLTAEDLVNNPSLAEAGSKEGDTILLPLDGFVTAEEAAAAGSTGEGPKGKTKKK